jgi:hypothetical protein
MFFWLSIWPNGHRESQKIGFLKWIPRTNEATWRIGLSPNSAQNYTWFKCAVLVRSRKYMNVAWRWYPRRWSCLDQEHHVGKRAVRQTHFFGNKFRLEFGDCQTTNHRNSAESCPIKRPTDDLSRMASLITVLKYHNLFSSQSSTPTWRFKCYVILKFEYTVED